MPTAVQFKRCHYLREAAGGIDAIGSRHGRTSTRGPSAHGRDPWASTRLATAIPDFFGSKLDQVSQSFAMKIEAMLARHVQEADRVIASVRESAAALFEIPLIPASSIATFVMKREPFWVTQKWDQTIGSLAGGAIDRRRR
jgi:hypothetical protein